MPRIRTLKPDAMQHRKVGKLSDRAFRLWIGMITQADDDGRLVADVDQLRLLCYGYHPRVTSVQVEEAMHEIARTQLIRLYLVAGTRYAEFPSWRDHQKIHRDHYTPSKLPSWGPPAAGGDDGGVRVPATSATPPTPSTEADPENIWAKGAVFRECGTPSVPIPHSNGIPPAGVEGKGVEWKGRETTSWSGSGKPDPRVLRAQAIEVLHFLNAKAHRSYREVDTTLRPIIARLRSGATVANCRGVIARKVREWGPDPKMAKYLRPETLFSATHFESYLGERPPMPTPEEEPHG